MPKTKVEHIFWDLVARNSAEKPLLVPIFGEYKKNELKKLIYDWIGETDNLNILKTDLFEEALGPDQLLFDMFKKDRVFGIDISKFIVDKAYARSRKLGRDCYFNVGDVRNLPYKKGSFDLVISNSTLDHLNKENLQKAISELKRVLKNSGRIILTMSNKHNIGFYIMSKIGIFLKIVPFPVKFYTIEGMKRIFSKNNIKIEKSSAIIHLLSPLNRIFLIFYYLLRHEIIDNIAKLFVSLAEKLGKIKTRYFTGWFLAFLLSKE